MKFENGPVARKDEGIPSPAVAMRPTPPLMADAA